MNITTSSFRIESKTNVIPTGIQLIGFSTDNYVIFKYNNNNTIQYANHYPTKNQSYLFFEIINNSPLWTINYQIIPYVGHYNTNAFFFDVKFIVNIDESLINDYINTSLALNFIISEKFATTPRFTNTDFTNKSFIPYYDPVKAPKDFKVKLYEYQEKTLAKMLQVENNTVDFTVNYTFNINFNGTDLLMDPISNTRVNNDMKLKITTTGGVLSDEMGLGKTISSIALIASNPAPKELPNTKYSNVSGFDKINSRATIVLCPSHLTKQWEGEIKRCNSNFKILTILTKTNYNKLTFNDFIEADIIITSHQFIMNFNFYPSLHYQPCTASSFNFDNRNATIKQYLQDKITKIGFPEIKSLELPIFEFFYFRRLILDEGHEIFGEMLGSIALGQYMSKWVSKIDASYYWYVSGTPFVNYTGIENCARFINLKLEDTERGISIDFQHINKHRNNTFNFINKEYMWNNILDKICIRHRKCDVENQIKIPGYEERIIWLKFTDLERQLYDAKKGKVTTAYLQQLCCHPLIVESSKKIFGDVEIDLALMQDKLIEYHKNNHEVYKVKLTKLDSTNPAFYMLKKSYETQMSESKYMFTILEKMKNPNVIEEENCSICMDKLDNPTLTACGHLFCYDCLKMCLGDKKRCPMCKADLTDKELLVMNIKVKTEEPINPLIKKYGSKLGKLISIIRFLVAQEDTRIIVFSQWDDMLSLVGKTLAENEIENCFVKGNVWSRNAAIRKFKAGVGNTGNDNKVIMLSLKNAASGTNLTEATHIFFVEPINAPREESKAIEGQAIARACRVGQKQKIMLMRILIENSIEEETYRQFYNKDIVVNFEEQNYMVEKVITNENPTDSSEEKPEETKPLKVVKRIRKAPVKKVETKNEIEI